MGIQLLGGEVTVLDSALEDVADGDDGTSYVVRQIPPEVSKAMGKRHKQKRNGPVQDVDALIDDLVDYAVMSWSGVLMNGEPVACTREHKLLLDLGRKRALIALAARNRVSRTEVREASFREPANVV